MPNQSSAAPEISMIVPVVERYGDLDRLYDEYAAELDQLGKAAEFIFVVDHRQRSAVPQLRELQQRASHEVILLLLGGSFGESASLTLGLERARGEILVTLASYFQVDPRGLAPALRELEGGADMVVGRRYPRIDSVFNRLQSRAFHWLVGLMTGSGFGDISCGFRVMRRRMTEQLSVYGGLHRFIPILAQRQGFAVHELKIPHRKEDVKTRYYGLAIYLKRLLDVLTVFFLLKFTQRPMRFFGLLGVLLSATGLGITGYLGVYRMLQLGPIAHRPLLLLGVLLMVLGIQVLSIGLLGEIIIFTHARQVRHLGVIEEIGGAVSDPSSAAVVVEQGEGGRSAADLTATPQSSSS